MPADDRFEADTVFPIDDDIGAGVGEGLGGLAGNGYENEVERAQGSNRFEGFQVAIRDSRTGFEGEPAEVGQCRHGFQCGFVGHDHPKFTQFAERR